MSVSMTAEMTTSQNRRSDSQTAAVWIMFTCCQTAGIFLIALARHRTSGTLPVKSHAGLTLQKFLQDFISLTSPHDQGGYPAPARPIP